MSFVVGSRSVYNSFEQHIDGFVKEGRNSIADSLELRLSCTNVLLIFDGLRLYLSIE